MDREKTLNETETILKNRILKGIEFSKDDKSHDRLLETLKIEWLNNKREKKPNYIFLAFWKEELYQEYCDKISQLEEYYKLPQEQAEKISISFLKLIDKISDMYLELKKI